MTAMSQICAILLGKESSWGTAVSRTISLPVLSESLQTDEGFYISGAMRSDPNDQVAVPGLRAVSGGLSVEPDAVALGHLLRAVFGTLTSAELAGRPAAAPAGTPAAGGSLTAGDYRYKVAAIVTDDVTGERRMLNPTESSDAITTATTNLTIDLTWSAPASVPTGTTLVDYAIFRTAIGGAADTEKFLALKGSTTASYSDTGAVSLDTTIAPPSRVYTHAFKRGTADPVSWSLEALKNNGSSELLVGTCVNSLALNIQTEGALGCELDILAKDISKATSSSPGFSLAAHPFMGHRTLVFFNDADDADTNFTLATQVSLNIANNLNGRRWLNNSRALSKVKWGRHQVTGQFMRELDDMATFDDFLDNVAKAITTQTVANPVADWELSDGTKPWPYRIDNHLPQVRLLTHQANTSNQDPVVQTVGFHALKDTSAGYTLQTTVHNLTASYS